MNIGVDIINNILINIIVFFIIFAPLISHYIYKKNNLYGDRKMDQDK